MTQLNGILLGIGAALAAVVLGALVALWIANGHLRTELTAARDQATALRMANAQFTAMVARQNTAVAALKADSEARARRATEATQAAATLAERYKAAAAALSARAQRGDACQAAEALLRGYGGGG